CEEKSDCQATLGFYNQRTAVAAFTERLRAIALDLDLIIEAQVAHPVPDDNIVELERGDAPRAQFGRPAQFGYLQPRGDELLPEARELAESLDSCRVGRHAVVHLSDRCIDQVRCLL